MLEIKKQNNAVHIWHKDGTYIGSANEIELMEFRCQIKEECVEGYFLTIEPWINDTPYNINKYGKIVNPDDRYIEHIEVYDELLNRYLNLGKYELK